MGAGNILTLKSIQQTYLSFHFLMLWSLLPSILIHFSFFQPSVSPSLGTLLRDISRDISQNFKLLSLSQRLISFFSSKLLERVVLCPHCQSNVLSTVKGGPKITTNILILLLNLVSKKFGQQFLFAFLHFCHKNNLVHFEVVYRIFVKLRNTLFKNSNWETL